LPPSERAAILAKLSPNEALGLHYDWEGFWARPNQLPPVGDWKVWLLLAGRGFGKTRCGAEWIRKQEELGVDRMALVAPTAGDARDVMVEGASGIINVCPSWNRPIYEPTKRRVTWPSGAYAEVCSADEPERLRGRNFKAAWCDEVASWRYPDAWDQLMLGLRLGSDPRCVVTATPKPVSLLIGSGRNGQRLGLLRDPTVAVTKGRTYDNRANLAPAFFDQIIRRYEGTLLGRQELEAEVLESLEGALWTHELIENGRVDSEAAVPPLIRVIVAIDPAVTSGMDSDETGIIVAGKDRDGHGWILADRSGRYAPAAWARQAVDAFQVHKADRIVAEVNNGGEMVENTIRMVAFDVPFRSVHASRGKVVRAEPVAALYEQARVHHVGTFPALEDQMTVFTTDFRRSEAGFSPDRVDALVWALTDLLVEPMKSEGIYELYRQDAMKLISA
jgi:phage terminase large subunit-like protein